MTQQSKTTDVFGIGNAIVDTLAFVDDDFIREHDLQRGSMTLTEPRDQGRLLAALEGQKVELHSGGSAANTMYGVAACGGSAFYASKVSRDANGEFYREDLLKQGIHFDVHPTDKSEGPTGTCIVLTTPDAERTMLTNLGVSTTLTSDDIDEARLAQCRFLYLEGYLWDADQPREAFARAAELAVKAGVKVSMTFSDPFCVERYRADFEQFTRDFCDFVFCNRDEVLSFAQTDDLDKAAAFVGELCDLAFITDGANGALVVENKEVKKVSGFVVKPMDTTGAGDAFAAGVLFALARDYSPEQAARWGNYMASRTIEVAGARVQVNFKDKVREIIG